ncbi:hypothetical protein BCR35DRAFT_299671 [Leucosporidium creatinivorum]|uniref:PCI domain-containing protein n=1 Tax=Leucosporidium creatinivorum TaxID=106004 RepID=A0A1Y2G4F7_9BASI|nr:hypothetical protein BCR35DRAFT_299671 [Leucosporidium creatinivorum]
MAPMTAPTFAHQLDVSLKQQAGHSLSQLLDLSHGHVVSLFQGLAPNDKYPENERPDFEMVYNKRLRNGNGWAEIATLHTKAVVALNDYRPDPMTQRPRPGGDAMKASKMQQELVNALYRWMMNTTTLTGWALPVLYQVCQDLKRIAMLADGQHVMRREKPVDLEDASRIMQKCFSACLNDRGSNNLMSRKMGTYYMAVLLFKVYFKLKSTALCKNLIKGIGAADLAPFGAYPVAHRVSYLYYMGVFAFLREDYTEAEKQFCSALSLCHAKARRNIELILDYLIPVLLLRGVLPSAKTLRKSERLSAIYTPFIAAYKSGDVGLYDRQLQAAEKRLMERGTYLIVERAREGAVRALVKKSWILEGKPARLSIDTFKRYYTVGAGIDIDSEEMECVLANMIYKGNLKGYISHQHQMVVLSKQTPFPWAPPFRDRGEAARKAREERELAERAKVPS